MTRKHFEMPWEESSTAFFLAPAWAGRKNRLLKETRELFL
jgi:hypothetical protein